MEAFPTGILTFLFTDMVGSTPLVHALGDRFLPLLEEHNAVLRRAWKEHGGIEVKTEGDSFFVVFEDPRAAVAAAVQGQQGLMAHQEHDGIALKVRMGMHTGEASLVGNDYIGPAVIVASRVQTAAHGDQILITDETLSAALPLGELTTTDLGLHGLKGVPTPVQIHQISGPGLPSIFPPPVTLRAARHNLPTAPTSLVGRDEMVSEVSGMLLDDAPVVSLIGPGGIGKTRLALEVGNRLLAYRPGGVFLVEAATMRSSDEILVGVAEAMKIELTDSSPVVDQIARRVDGHMLVVTDNLEHISDAGEAIAQLVATVPNIQVLATSRTRLRIRAERCVTVEPLSLPPAGADLDALAEAASSALFLERARAVSHGYRFSTADAEVVGELTRRLDGLPLAIELAAARLAERTLSQILEGLADAAELLAEGDLDLPPRQRSMEAAIRWSLDLLPDPAREVLAAASVFRGGAARDALEAVMRRGIDRDLDILTAASLIRRSTDGRVSILEPIRAIAEPRNDPRFAEAHVGWFLDLARRAWEGIAGAQQQEWAARMGPEDANLDVAIQRADPETALEIAALAGRVWGRTGKLLHGIHVVESSLERAPATAGALARAHLVIGNLRRLLGHLAEARADLARAVDLAVERHDSEIEVLAQIQLAEVDRALGDHQRGRDALEELLPRISDARLHAMALQNLALTYMQTDAARSMQLLDESADGFAHVLDRDQEAGALANLALVAVQLGQHDRAGAALDRALTVSSELDPMVRAQVEVSAGLVAFHAGDPDEAERVTRRALERYEAMDRADAILLCRQNLSTFIGEDASRMEESAQLAEEAVRFGRSRGLAVPPDLLYRATYAAFQVHRPARIIDLISADDLEQHPLGGPLSVLLAVAQADLGNPDGAEQTLRCARSRPGLALIMPDPLEHLRLVLGPERFSAAWPEEQPQPEPPLTPAG